MPNTESANWWSRTIVFIRDNEYMHHILVVILLSTIFLSAFHYFRNVEHQYRGSLTGERKNAVSFSEVLFHIPLTDAEKARLFAQLDEMCQRQRHHFRAMEIFYANSFLTLSMAILAAVLAAGCLAVTTRYGFSATPRYIVTALVLTAGVTSFFGAMPTVFEYSDNVQANKTLFLYYTALRQEAISYLSVGESLDGRQATPTEYIHYLDRALNEYDNVAIGFDATRVPTPSADGR